MEISVALQRPEAAELALLFDAAGWGTNSAKSLARSIAAYPCTICARTDQRALVGYLSAFSDEVMSTMLGELVVHPSFRRRGIGASMLAELEQRYPEAPIYIKALGNSKLFYESLRFKQPKAEFTVLFKRPVPSSSKLGEVQPSRAAESGLRSEA